MNTTIGTIWRASYHMGPMEEVKFVNYPHAPGIPYQSTEDWCVFLRDHQVPRVGSGWKKEFSARWGSYPFTSVNPTCVVQEVALAVHEGRVEVSNVIIHEEWMGASWHCYCTFWTRPVE